MICFALSYKDIPLDEWPSNISQRTFVNSQEAIEADMTLIAIVGIEDPEIEQARETI